VAGTATTGADGAYAFADLDGGEYTVIATGYPPVATALTVTGGGADDHDIELAHPGEGPTPGPWRARASCSGDAPRHGPVFS